jgi:hypothetical protein
MLSKGFAGETVEVEKKEAELNLPPTALLSQGYAEAHPEPKKATKATTVEITKGE